MKSELKTAIRVKDAVAAENGAEAYAAALAACRLLDKGCFRRKQAIHKNQAANRERRHAAREEDVVTEGRRKAYVKP